MKKKLLSVVLTAVMAATVLTGCGSTDNGTASTTAGSAAQTEAVASTDGKVYNIGICQLVEHEALDAATQGFQDALKDKLGDNVKFDLQNAQGEQTTAATICNGFVSDGVDLILANATSPLQSAAAATTSIPILGTSVTDYATALEISDWSGATGRNISGTSDLAPIEEQEAMLKELFPDVKQVGLLYCSAEANSKFQVGLAKKEAKKLGLTTVDATVSESSEIRQVVESLKGKVDAIYSPTDNMIAAGINTVSMVANEAKIPFIVAEEGMCTGGGLATYGVNYYKLGQQTAKQAVKILEGKAEPKDMPIEYQENADLIINKDTVKTLGIKIPEKLKKEAKMVTTQKKTDKE